MCDSFIKKQTPFIFLFFNVLLLTIPTSFGMMDIPTNLSSYIIVLKDDVSADDLSNDYELIKTHEYKHA